jgi:hypothetical protein
MIGFSKPKINKKGQQELTGALYTIFKRRLILPQILLVIKYFLLKTLSFQQLENTIIY